MLCSLATIPPKLQLSAEFIGTFFLVLTAGLNVQLKSLAPALSIGAALSAMIYSLGSVSGAHLNPAVTLAIFLSGRGKIAGAEAAQYACAQTFGAICAGFTYAALCRQETFGIGPSKKYGWWSAGAAEALFTAILCLTVLAVATTAKNSRDMFGLAIGREVLVWGRFEEEICIWSSAVQTQHIVRDLFHCP